jgi:hypothetical protein
MNNESKKIASNEKEGLIILIVEYTDVDKAVRKFCEFKNCWVERYGKL